MKRVLSEYRYRIQKPVFRERIFFLPKEGDIGQDRFARSYSRKVWVLCDGASEGYDGGGWAKDLSRYAVRFSSLQRAVRVARIIRTRKMQSWEDLDWSSILAMARGSYSTLLRVRILPRTIEVEGVGDTAVFCLKGDEWAHVFPSAEIEFFQKDPCLLSDRTQDEIPPIVHYTIHWRKARTTSLLLATDALAAYLIKIGKEKRREIFTLFHRGTVGRIRKTLAEEMKNMRIKRDDLSFVWLELKRSTRWRKRVSDLPEENRAW